jgi:DNA-binding winged helix-turn-helix (wHTH) protein
MPGDLPEIRPGTFIVGDLYVDVGQQRVTRAGSDIALTNLSFRLLLALVRAAPDVLSNESLMMQVWPGLVVSPETVNKRVNLLRDALDDDPREPRYIALVRSRGYRLSGSYTSQPNDPRYSAPILLGMDDSNQIGGLAFGRPFGDPVVSALSGTVSGNTFTGTASYTLSGSGRPHTFHSPVSGTYSTTASGITLDGQFSTINNQEVVTFSTVGCRAN